MQVSAVPNMVWYVPVQPAPPIAPVARRDEDASDDAARRVRSSNPPGVGSLFDIEA